MQTINEIKNIENPLLKMIIIANANHELWLRENDDSNMESNRLNEDLITPITSNTKTYEDNKKGYSSIELAGIAKFFEYIRKNTNETVVFENTLAYTLHGIDVVTKDSEGIYTIYEIKGTTKKITKPQRYLRKTKRRGRQLSLQWCWYSLTDHVSNPASANLFLTLLDDFLNMRVRRKVGLIKCVKEDDGSFRGEDVEIHDFEDLNIKESYDLSRPRVMYEEIKEIS